MEKKRKQINKQTNLLVIMERTKSKSNVVQKRGPGRPRGSKNRSKTSHHTSPERTRRPAGRPKGSRNKKGVKIRTPSKVDAAQLYQSASGARPGQGTITDLLDILDNAVKKGWSDERILEFFGPESTEESRCDLENECHFYSSSKGRLVAENNTLSTCVLFPGVKLTEQFLLHYIHSFDDVLTYGEHIAQTSANLYRRARELQEEV